MFHDPFLQIACPVCGRAMSATDMKANGETENGVFERYSCTCGARFTVTVEVG